MTDASPKPHAARDTFRMFEAAQRFEFIAEMYDGEYTPDVASAERKFLEAEEAAIDSLLDYRDYARAMKAEAKRMIERYEDVIARYDGRLERVEGHLRTITERKIAGTKRKSFNHGPLLIGLYAGSEYVHVDPDVKVEELPPHVVRYVEPRPGHHEVDKKAAKEAIKAGDKIPGLEVRRRAPRLEIK